MLPYTSEFLRPKLIHAVALKRSSRKSVPWRTLLALPTGGFSVFLYVSIYGR